jgi:pSer/pThr/pTyr-binding forkhead associated (FHA) protein/tetratricopeptide (TPR) repeat protein
VTARFKFILKNDPQTIYEIQQDTFLLGRSEDCEVIINDPHVSRLQAKVWAKNDKYVIKNLGRNPILVNGVQTKSRYLNDGDTVTFGKTELLFQAVETRDEIIEIPRFAEQTVALTSPVGKILSPRLVLSNSMGESKIFLLDKDKLSIGRSGEVDVDLEDPSVSRNHCIIENQDNAYFVKNLSEINPTLLNEERVSEKRLYSGDQLRIGSFSLTFISDRPQDLKPIEETIITQEKGPGWVLWCGAACLLLLLGSYVFYGRVYRPWKVGRTLKFVSTQIDSGDYRPARDTLMALLESDLPQEDTRKTMDLLSQTTVRISQKMAEDGELQDAKDYLIGYLQNYGAGKEAEVMLERVDYYRLLMGEMLESEKKYQLATRQYASIREESLYFKEAQTAIHRIWLAYQQKRYKDQTLTQLLKEGETHFSAKRYLTPVNQNAYSAYQAVLAIDSENQVALERIDQIKTYYREIGDKYFAQKEWLKALTYFERYSLIDPELPDVKEKISICKNKLAASKIPPAKPKRPKAAPKEKTDDQREKIKRVLEESGAKSSWIMKYLFEEQSGEKDPDKPW